MSHAVSFFVCLVSYKYKTNIILYIDKSTQPTLDVAIDIHSRESYRGEERPIAIILPPLNSNKHQNFG